MNKTPVNESLSELRLENNILTNDLRFERNLNQILENIKNYSLVLMKNCKCDTNGHIRQKLSQFTRDYEEMKNRRHGRQHTDRQQHNNGSASDPQMCEYMDKSDDNSCETDVTNMLSIELKVIPICSECHQLFDSEMDLEIHMNGVHKNTQSFVCQTCSQVFDNRDVFSNHLTQKHNIIVSNDDSNGFEDLEENSDFYSDQLSPRTVSRKRKSMSGQSKRKRGRPKKSGSSLEIKREPNVDEDLDEDMDNNALSMINESAFSAFKCNECQKCFGSETGLEKHVNKDHKKSKEFVCEHCSQSFYANNSLLNHLSQKHKILAFECDLCNHKTYSKYHLDRHRNTHSADKPYVCGVVGCNKTFGRKDNLLAHKRLVHSMEGLLACDWPECGQRFDTKPKLRDHKTSVHQLSALQDDVC